MYFKYLMVMFFPIICTEYIDQNQHWEQTEGI